jgi:mRNA interferase MazF
VQLNPARGREIRKSRPCVVVSPDDLNAHVGTFIVAPLTTDSHPYPFRIPVRFTARDGHVVLDQLRTVDRERLVKRRGALTAPTHVDMRPPASHHPLPLARFRPQLRSCAPLPEPPP